MSPLALNCPLNLLIVEDEPINRAILELYLRKLGHRFVSVGDGGEALRVLHKQKFDLILMDINMPVMDGIEATQQIRLGEAGIRAQKTPIYAISSEFCRKEEALACGMNGFLDKPLDPLQLTHLLGDVSPNTDTQEHRSSSPDCFLRDNQ
ncbi:MAG: hypothetical protein C0621_10925 [Desulfuromonas sp.]|nr:MAG: hypothetical protein C0621_10925 [Desulfuromonas sp.]